MKKLFLALLFLIAFPLAASAQCNGVFSAGHACGTTTSGTPASIQSEALYANDFGAKCDASTDDAAVFNTTATAALSHNMAMSWTGNCRVASTITIAGALEVRGQGLLASAISPDTNITVFDNTTFGAHFSNFNIGFPNAAPCGSAQSNTSSIAFKLEFSNFNGPIIDNVWIQCAWTGMLISGVTGGTAKNILMTNISHYGFDFELDGSNRQPVDWEISSSPGLIMDSTTTTTEVVHCAACSGLRFMHNKINGGGPGWKYGINVQIAIADGDLFVVGNSFEGFSSSQGACIEIARASGGVAFWGNVVIVGNELNCFRTVEMPTDAFAPTSQWFTGLTITGNDLTSNDDAVHVDNMVDLNFTANHIEIGTGAASKKPIVIGSHVNTGVAGPNACVVTNFTSPASISACTASTNGGTSITTIAPF